MPGPDLARHQSPPNAPIFSDLFESEIVAHQSRDDIPLPISTFIVPNALEEGGFEHRKSSIPPWSKPIEAIIGDQGPRRADNRR